MANAINIVLIPIYNINICYNTIKQLILSIDQSIRLIATQIQLQILNQVFKSIGFLLIRKLNQLGDRLY